MLNIYLDMDGVLTNWVDSVLKIVGKDELIGNWPVGAQSIEQATGMTYEDIRSQVEALGSDFWRHMEVYPWVDELIDTLSRHGDLYICTAPSRDPNCHKGKMEWLQDRFGKEYRDYVFTRHKYMCASNGLTLLVDDTNKQIDAFTKAGGYGLLFPQPCNGGDLTKDKIKYVENKIGFIQSVI